MKLKKWVTNLPIWLRITIGVLVGVIGWIIVIIIITANNVFISFKQLFQYWIADFRSENRIFKDFFKSLLTKES